MRVRDVMTKQVATIKSVSFLPEAAKLMLDEDIGTLPVVDDGKFVGMLTDRDITVRAVAQGKDVSQTKVGDVLTKENLVTVSPDTDLRQAETLMEANKVRRLPVVETSGNVVGILGLADIVHDANEREGAEVLEHVTEPGGEHCQNG